MSAPAISPAVLPRGCAVCGAVESRALYSQRFAMISESSLFTGYDVVACGSCGYCYADGLPPQSVFDRYYREMSKYEGAAATAPVAEVSVWDRMRFAPSVRLVQRFAPRRESLLLEVGCATGSFLGQLRDAGYTNVCGLDPSAECARIARASFDCPVWTGTLADDLTDLPRADVLILIGVLEHLRDLSAALTVCSSLLAPGGHILIAVPDASRYPDGEDAPYQEFSVEHVNFFGPRSLANLMARYGFRAVASEQSLQRCNAVTVTPVLHMMFARTDRGRADPWERDETTAPALEAYVRASALDDQRVRDRLRPYLQSGQRLIVWGAGTHTLRLFATGVLSPDHVDAVVDSNPRYHGKEIDGIPIIGPQAIGNRTSAIVVSSRPSQAAICRYIVDDLCLPNELVTLYDLANLHSAVDPAI